MRLPTHFFLTRPLRLAVSETFFQRSVHAGSQAPWETSPARRENLVGKSSLSSRMKRGTFRQHKTTQHQVFMEIDGQFEPIRDEAGPIRSTRLPLRHCSCDPTRARNASVSHEVLTYVMFFARLVKKGIFPSPEIISPMPPKVVCSWVNIAWATDGF